MQTYPQNCQHLLIVLVNRSWAASDVTNQVVDLVIKLIAVLQNSFTLRSLSMLLSEGIGL